MQTWAFNDNIECYSRTASNISVWEAWVIKKISVNETKIWMKLAVKRLKLMDNQKTRKWISAVMLRSVEVNVEDEVKAHWEKIKSKMVFPEMLEWIVKVEINCWGAEDELSGLNHKGDNGEVFGQGFNRVIAVAWERGYCNVSADFSAPASRSRCKHEEM